MPIPALTAEGFLPVGVHLCNLSEVETAFGTNDHRLGLISGLRSFVDWLADRGIVQPYCIDGSFVTSKPEPRDIDFLLDVTAASPLALHAAMHVYVTDRTHIKDTFRIDYFPQVPGAHNDFRAFFSYIRVEELQQRGLPAATRKGILRIEP